MKNVDHAERYQQIQICRLQLDAFALLRGPADPLIEADDALIGDARAIRQGKCRLIRIAAALQPGIGMAGDGAIQVLSHAGPRAG